MIYGHNYMKILITGSTGMVGKNIIEREELKNFSVLSPSSKDLNLLDINNVEKYLSSHMPDMIIHCAGKVGGIQANMKDMTHFLSDNLIMGINLVNSSKKLGIKRFLNLGSSCMYPRNAENPLKEEMILKGELEPTNEGYALAKITVAKLCQYISNEYEDFSYKTIIPCNLYGRWDKFDPKHSHMIPAVISKLHHAKEHNLDQIDIWGDGTARREFMYVGDLANFIIQAIEKFDSLPLTSNIGLGYDYTINEFYKTIAEVVGYQGSFVYDLTKPVGMKQKLIDTTIINNWGWKAETNLKDGIQKTLEFYLAMEKINAENKIPARK